MKIRPPKTICFDFDGVINSYKSGWSGDDSSIPDPPVEGMSDLIRTLYEDGYEIKIYSTRLRSSVGRRAVKDYCRKMGIDECISDYSYEKPPALVYIDDRAITFRGTTEGLYDQIRNFKPWTKEVR